MTEASFQAACKERNRSDALAKKNDAIALEKLGRKRSGNNLYSLRRGECSGGSSVGGGGYTGRDLRSVSYFLVGWIQGRIPLDSVRGKEKKARRRAAGRGCNSDWERPRRRERKEEKERSAGEKRRRRKSTEGKKEEDSTKLAAVPPRHFVALSKASLQMLPATTAIHSYILVSSNCSCEVRNSRALATRT